MTGTIKKAAPRTPPDVGESHAAVALTVAWMLTFMSTAAGLGVAFALRLLAATLAAGNQPPLLTISGVLLMVALLTGILCLLFTGLAFRIRRTPPPRSIAIAAVLVGLAPIAALVAAIFSTT